MSTEGDGRTHVHIGSQHRETQQTLLQKAGVGKREEWEYNGGSELVQVPARRYGITTMKSLHVINVQ
jgi:hypothetical protein